MAKSVPIVRHLPKKSRTRKRDVKRLPFTEGYTKPYLSSCVAKCGRDVLGKVNGFTVTRYEPKKLDSMYIFPRKSRSPTPPEKRVTFAAKMPPSGEPEPSGAAPVGRARTRRTHSARDSSDDSSTNFESSREVKRRRTLETEAVQDAEVRKATSSMRQRRSVLQNSSSSSAQDSGDEQREGEKRKYPRTPGAVVGHSVVTPNVTFTDSEDEDEREGPVVGKVTLERLFDDDAQVDDNGGQPPAEAEVEAEAEKAPADHTDHTDDNGGSAHQNEAPTKDSRGASSSSSSGVADSEPKRVEMREELSTKRVSPPRPAEAELAHSDAEKSKNSTEIRSTPIDLKPPSPTLRPPPPLSPQNPPEKAPAPKEGTGGVRIVAGLQSAENDYDDFVLKLSEEAAVVVDESRVGHPNPENSPSSSDSDVDPVSTVDERCVSRLTRRGATSITASAENFEEDVFKQRRSQLSLDDEEPMEISVIQSQTQLPTALARSALSPQPESTGEASASVADDEARAFALNQAVRKKLQSELEEVALELHRFGSDTPDPTGSQPTRRSAARGDDQQAADQVDSSPGISSLVADRDSNETDSSDNTPPSTSQDDDNYDDEGKDKDDDKHEGGEPQCPSKIVPDHLSEQSRASVETSSEPEAKVPNEEPTPRRKTSATETALIAEAKASPMKQTPLDTEMRQDDIAEEESDSKSTEVADEEIPRRDEQRVDVSPDETSAAEAGDMVMSAAEKSLKVDLVPSNDCAKDEDVDGAAEAGVASAERRASLPSPMEEEDEQESDEVGMDKVGMDKVENDEVESDKVENDEMENDKAENDEMENDKVENGQRESDKVESDELENDEVKNNKVMPEEIESAVAEEAVEKLEEVVPSKTKPIESSPGRSGLGTASMVKKGDDAQTTTSKETVAQSISASERKSPAHDADETSEAPETSQPAAGAAAAAATAAEEAATAEQNLSPGSEVAAQQVPGSEDAADNVESTPETDAEAVADGGATMTKQLEDDGAAVDQSLIVRGKRVRHRTQPFSPDATPKRRSVRSKPAPETAAVVPSTPRSTRRTATSKTPAKAATAEPKTVRKLAEKAITETEKQTRTRTPRTNAASGRAAGKAAGSTPSTRSAKSTAAATAASKSAAKTTAQTTAATADPTAAAAAVAATATSSSRRKTAK